REWSEFKQKGIELLHSCSKKAIAAGVDTESTQITGLRQAVFVLEQDCPYIDADGKDQASWHLCGRDQEGILVAYTRIVPKGISYADHVSIGRVITSQSVRQMGVGRVLMEETIAACGYLFGKEAIKISAQSYLIKFYQSLGFERIGEEYLEDGIPHLAMIKKA
ncbi:MAG: GNAT family N-acetyltransferase, partial [Bacteroidota bacterium]